MSERNVRLDLRGLKCPLPALHTRRALERASAGTLIEVECTDPMSVIDIPALVLQSGHILEAETKSASAFTFRIRASGR
ncbi:sulfurtransferase TusA family protein [Starkeya sp. ORNL1]|uniref:sulfurtransferase TusA family protein n=1 Tax=Starkeya sp. ORNL1 TaxID=2709380 RepID=UPI001463ECFF|nr:sulfurtransferase TusA family protein [Starkeya sp. ORNL1]QJP12729.1 sulfurtransferase TusA family protein [Starkeya sp. ORNL1]